MTNITICILILQICIIGGLARTNQDVVDDFAPVFDYYHSEFSKLEDKCKVEIVPLFENIQQTLDNETIHVNNIIKEQQSYINETAEQIIIDSGLSDKPELIVSCLSQLNENEIVLQDKTLGSARICLSLANIQLNSTQTYADTLQTQLHNEHYSLEVTREECAKYGGPNDVLECLLRDLYIFFKPYLVDVKQEITRRLGVLQEDYKTLRNNLDMCDTILQNGVKVDVADVIQDFAMCIKSIEA